MTFLPAAADAIVAVTKVRQYILDANHPENGGKAELFARFGFGDHTWPEFVAALRRHPLDNPVAVVKEPPHGTKFVVRCRLATPDGRDPCRTTVWMIDRAGTAPRLITTY